MKKVMAWLKARRLLVFASLLVVFLGIGATTAWFTDIEAAINVFTVGENSITIDEDLVGLSKKNISITNTGNIPVYVRMAVDVPEGITYIDGENVEQTLSFTFDPKEPKDWTYEEDGYWYYNHVLPAGAKAVLFNSVELENEIPAAEMERIKELLDITVYGESIQSEGFPEEEGITTAKEAFGYLAEQEN